MNKLSTLPVGYKPTNLSEIRTYCQGNNVFHQKPVDNLTYDWRTDDGVPLGRTTAQGVGSQ